MLRCNIVAGKLVQSDYSTTCRLKHRNRYEISLKSAVISDFEIKLSCKDAAAQLTSFCDRLAEWFSPCHASRADQSEAGFLTALAVMTLSGRGGAPTTRISASSLRR